MNNIIVRFKKFLGNKNTVTILGVIIGVAVLLVGYNYRVKQAVKPMEIPFAIAKINAKNKIDVSNISTIKVSKAFVKQNPDLVTEIDELYDQYVTSNTTIPAGGLFYDSQITTKENLPEDIFDELKNGVDSDKEDENNINEVDKGITIFRLEVDANLTYGNSIMPGNYIDLYVKTTETDPETGEKIIFGKFIESIKVLAVRDAADKDVFEDSDIQRTPSQLLFAVKHDFWLLLTSAKLVGGIEIIPIPRNQKYGAVGSGTGISVSNKTLIDIIEAKISEKSDQFDPEVLLPKEEIGSN